MIAKIVNYYALVLFLRPPNLLRRGPFFERKIVCNSQGKLCSHKVHRDGKSPRRTKNTTRRKFTTRSIGSTAGSFGEEGPEMRLRIAHQNNPHPWDRLIPLQGTKCPQTKQPPEGPSTEDPSTQESHLMALHD